MNKQNISKAKEHKISRSTKITIWLNNLDMNPIETPKRDKYDCINYYANKLVETHNKKIDEYDNFRFELLMEPKEIDILKFFFKKHKKFIINHIKENGTFTPSHLYQLYLQYIPYVLTDFEKNVFLDGYVSVLADINDHNSAIEKRKTLEQNLRINMH